MADIMRQRQRLGQILIQAESSGNSARDLRNLDSVCQPVAEMIGQPWRKHLRLVFQTAEGSSVDYTVAVPLKLGPVGMGKLGVTPSARAFHWEAQMSQRPGFH